MQGQEGPGWKCGCSGLSCLEEEDCEGYLLIQVCLELPWDSFQDEWPKNGVCVCVLYILKTFLYSPNIMQLLHLLM